MGFRIAAQWEEDALDCCVGEAREEVALVFVGIGTAGDAFHIAIVDDLCIMAGSHGFAAKRHGVIEEFSEFNAFVASDTWRGRLAVCVGMPCIGKDDVFEIIAYVADEMIDAEIIGDGSSFIDGVVAGTYTRAVGIALYA